MKPKKYEKEIAEKYLKLFFPVKVNLERRIEEFISLFGTRALEDLLNDILEHRGIEEIKLKDKRN